MADRAGRMPDYTVELEARQRGAVATANSEHATLASSGSPSIALATSCHSRSRGGVVVVERGGSTSSRN